MDLDLNSLPDDASLPKDIVISLLDSVEIKYQEKIHHLEEQLRLFKNELFGHSSERRHEPHPDQLPLFNGDDEHAADGRQANDDTIVIAAHARKKRGRKPLPKDLPRIDIIHDLSEDQKQCACGARLSRFGQEVSEKLDDIPARLRVERHIRYKYACKNCDGVEDDGPTVRIAPVPVQLTPKAMPAPVFWRTLPYPSLPTGCRCIGNRRYLIIWALKCPGRSWPNGWFKPHGTAPD